MKSFLKILLLLMLSGCRTTEEPQPVQEPVAVPEPEPVEIPRKEPEPLDIDWAGSVWIQPDPGSANSFPGYRGFYLGLDGRLLLINMNSALGGEWEVTGSRMILSIESGEPKLPVEGRFVIHPSDPESIRLVPESQPDSEGLRFSRAYADIDIVENHWIPKSLAGGDQVLWPANREIHLMLLPDLHSMGILGYGGVNRFRGPVSLGRENFSTGSLTISRRTGAASGFENLYVQRIKETDRYVQVNKDLFLYQDNQFLAGFRVRLFD